MKVRTSTIVESMFLFSVISNTYILGALGIAGEPINVLTKVIPILLFLICNLFHSIRVQIAPYRKYADIYILLWFLFFTAETIYSINMYGSSIQLSEIISNYWNYTSIVLVYPMLYLLTVYGEGILCKIINVTLFDTLLRGIGCVSATVLGSSIFPFFQTRLMGIRIIFYRLFATNYFGLSFVSALCIKKYSKNRMRTRWMAIVCFWTYLILIDQSRTKIVATAIVFVLWLPSCFGKYFFGTRNKKLLYWSTITVLVVLFLISGGYDIISSSFSVTGVNAGSTTNRLFAMNYYNKVIKGKEMLGMGLIYDDTIYGRSSLYNILRNPAIETANYAFYEDFGILGQFYNFGIIGVLLFMLLFIRFYKILGITKNSSNNSMLKLLFIQILIYSILPMSAFAQGTVYIVPLYIAIFEYYCQRKDVSENEKCFINNR